MSQKVKESKKDKTVNKDRKVLDPTPLDKFREELAKGTEKTEKIDKKPQREIVTFEPEITADFFNSQKRNARSNLSYYFKHERISSLRNCEVFLNILKEYGYNSVIDFEKGTIAIDGYRKPTLKK